MKAIAWIAVLFYLTLSIILQCYAVLESISCLHCADNIYRSSQAVTFGITAQCHHGQDMEHRTGQDGTEK